ncbi:hypothetical protein AB4059_04355 [Lysobacter sp. 2RAF19]
MQTANALSLSDITLADLQAGAGVASLMDVLLPVDTSSTKPQMIVSDCCSSNNYDER